MNFKIFLQSFGLLLASSLIGYAFNVLGVTGSIVDSVWKLLAFDLGASLAIGISYPHIRGVRKNDELAINSSVASMRGPGINITFGSFGIANAYALSGGRIGDKIKVRLLDGRQGEGRVTDYAGLFSPAKVQMIEMEKLEPNAFASDGRRMA